MTSPTEPDPARASADLVESLTRLVRAEAKVLSTELFRRMSQGVAALLFLASALLLVPAALTVIALGPFLAENTSWLVTCAAAGPLLGLTIATCVRAAMLASRAAHPAGPSDEPDLPGQQERNQI